MCENNKKKIKNKNLNRLLGRPTPRATRVGLPPTPTDRRDPRVGETKAGEGELSDSGELQLVGDGPSAKARVPPCSPWPPALIDRWIMDTTKP
jgi:hypothetical protein